MKKAALYIHGKGGDFTEVESYRKNLSGCEVVGVDYAIDFPWITEKPIRAAYDALRREYGSIVLIANSIGAYLAMHALQDCPVGKALFISPVLDMERLILDMMGWAGATDSDLREQGELPTDFGETLSSPTPLPGPFPRKSSTPPETPSFPGKRWTLSQRAIPPI